jgi:polysaccharide export outer membrane protein
MFMPHAHRDTLSPARKQALLALCIVALAVLVLLSACGHSSALPPAPPKASVEELAYRIGPMDTLNVIVWRNPDLSGPVTVRPDGRVSTPLAADMVAAGRTPAELGKQIEQSLAQIVRDPVVTVIVTGFQGTYGEQVRIVGEAAKPQGIPYRKDMSVLDVMVATGGLTDFAEGNAAVLVRGSDAGKQYGLRLRDLLKRGDMSANVPVLPGDIIIIPQAWF